MKCRGCPWSSGDHLEYAQRTGDGDLDLFGDPLRPLELSIGAIGGRHRRSNDCKHAATSRPSNLGQSVASKPRERIASNGSDRTLTASRQLGRRCPVRPQGEHIF